MKKIRVGVIYGGRSGEHEVSVVSASSIFKHLDRERYEPVPIRIEKDGRWVIPPAAPAATSTTQVAAGERGDGAMTVEPTAAVASVDVVFPVLHGPYGEDGSVQGLLEVVNVPYVGAGVLGSAVGMDKAVMKTLFAASGLPIVPHVVVLRRDWHADAAAVTARVAHELRYPVFVKPANLGSSVGISKAKSDAEFAEAMRVALQYDRKIVIEAAVPKVREIECSVLGNDEPEVSVPGEIVPSSSREFYDYEAKYVDDASHPLIPAPLTDAQRAEIQRLALEAFRAVDGAGMSRVDFLMAGDSGAIFLNEVNTIPGFTSISMYPKMWEASGLAYPDLIHRLLTLARDRHAEKQQLRTSIT